MTVQIAHGGSVSQYRCRVVQAGRLHPSSQDLHIGSILLSPVSRLCTSRSFLYDSLGMKVFGKLALILLRPDHRYLLVFPVTRRIKTQCYSNRYRDKGSSVSVRLKKGPSFWQRSQEILLQFGPTLDRSRFSVVRYEFEVGWRP